MLAAKVNNYKNVEILLNSGANPFLKDQLGQQASDYCVSQLHSDKGHNSVQEMLHLSKAQWLQ